jgi:hypothetical protein
MWQNAALKGEPGPTTVEEERRAYPRVGSTRPIPRRIYRVEDFVTLDAWITDLSAKGIGLLVSGPQPLGIILFIEMESLPEAPPLKVWATVVRCDPALDGEWFVGCELINELSDRQLETVLL